jgi:tRNA-2-methylthio-N6-dimethylallyladenosine synthase
MESIRSELEDIAATGCREVVLLGQNVDAFGRDLSPRRTLSDLLRFIHDVPGIERIRFTTSHPRYISQSLITTCAELPKVCESFHIPPQSGDDDVLRSMGRGYTADRFRAICANIRASIPDAGISGDIIVGAPGDANSTGETEEQFQRSLDLIRSCQLDTTNTAAYSPRPNTPAAEWPNQVDDAVKSDRLSRINKVATEVALQRSQRFLGTIQEVLVEDANPKDNLQVMGRNRANRITRLDGDIAVLRNKLVKCRITAVTPYSLIGTIIGEPY